MGASDNNLYRIEIEEGVNNTISYMFRDTEDVNNPHAIFKNTERPAYDFFEINPNEWNDKVTSILTGIINKHKLTTKAKSSIE